MCVGGGGGGGGGRGVWVLDDKHENDYHFPFFYQMFYTH